MKAGAFELKEPIPQLSEAQALVILSPWIDVGRVGTGVLNFLEAQSQAAELGKLEKPGVFYDFTRYRPTVYRVEGRREVRIPNTFINYAHREGGPDMVFLHCLEPHLFGEYYVESVLKVLEVLSVKRYCLLGGMYDSVPHTRPLLVTGTASDEATDRDLRRMNVTASTYQGATTINVLVSEEAPRLGIQTMSMIAHLPYYAQVDEDYAGQEIVLRLLASLFRWPLDLTEVKKKAEEQYREVNMAVKANPRLKEILEVLEIGYDARSAKAPDAGAPSPLSPEIEKFLKDLDKGFSSGSS